MRRRRVAASLLAGLLLAAGWSTIARGQGSAALPIEPVKDSGQSVTGAFEGWYQNPDGTYTLLVGYFNRNLKQTLDIPVGPSNRIEPGGPDLGQPTHFQPRRQWGVFTIVVPKDFGKQRLTWTIVANGQTTSVPLHVDLLWIVAPFKDVALGNTPPSLRLTAAGAALQGPPKGIAATYTATVSTPLPLNIWASDDGIRAPEARRPARLVSVAWSKFRGPGDVTFTNAAPAVDEKTGESPTTASFAVAGEYILRVQVNDATGEGGGGFQCCWTNAHVKVVVKFSECLVGPVLLDRPASGTSDQPGQSSPTMTTQFAAELQRKPLRLWPGVSAVALQCLLWIIDPLIIDWDMLVAVFGGLILGLVVVVWWLFFSRAPWPERVGAIVLMIAGVAATYPMAHPSMSNAGQGGLLAVFSVPPLCLALVGWASMRHRFSTGPRWIALAVAIALGCGVMLLLRTGGVGGSNLADLHWRWTPSPEERLLARGNDDVPLLTAVPAPAAPTESVPVPVSAAPAGKETTETVPVPTAAPVHSAWPGFRGPERDSIVRGVRIDTDWSRTPPQQLWRKPIGPGWSSFAVRGTVLYTQEQRGDDEIVAAYNMNTGQPVWRHRDPARFWESNGGAGPRGTPTLTDDGRVYTFGGTGILNALDAESGKAIWSRNAASDLKATVPIWGISSSPLVIDDVVVVAVYGQLAAYDRATGKPRWKGPVHNGSYASPHLMTLGGVVQILQGSGIGLTSVAPDGTLLWEHQWSGGTIVQPALLPEGDVLITALGGTGGAGMKRIAVTNTSGKWTTEERWTSSGLKPYFNDFVAHNGYAYGFDGSILAAIDLKDGTRKWKGGRYGQGQLVLFPDQDLLLVTSEEGEVALVKATPDQFTELARFKALDGKTWNHPVVLDDVLFVRNGEEMAAFRLPRATP